MYWDILQFVTSHQYLEYALKNEKKNMRRLSMGFLLEEKILYKKGRDRTLLRCVETTEANRIHEGVFGIHEGVCGIHANNHIMT